jgi:hypothetical protein
MMLCKEHRLKDLLKARIVTVKLSTKQREKVWLQKEYYLRVAQEKLESM